MQALHDKITSIADELNSCIMERESTVENALLALIAREHLLILGPPGTAKSLLTRALCHHIDGAQYFETLMNQTTVPDELYGPINLIKYSQEGKYTRNSQNSLTEAHICFIDEIWKGNSVVNNTLLGIMNERIYHEVGMSPQTVPLLSMFAASNEVPADEDGLGALNDRFLLREVVHYIADEQNFIALLTQPMDISAGTAKITLEELQAIHKEILAIKGTPEALQALLALRTALAEQGIVPSDRKWRQCAKLLKAKAWYDGDTELHVEHLTCLASALWIDPKDEKTVKRIVYSIACPLNVKALEIQDMAEEVYATLPKASDSNFNTISENVLQQLSDQYRLLKDELANSEIRNASTVENVLNRLHTLHKQVSTAVYKNMAKFSL